MNGPRGDGIHSSSPFQCSLCGTGVMKVVTQIFSHLDSQKHKKKCHEYCVEITATEPGGGNCLPPDLLAAYLKKSGKPTTVIAYPEFKPDGDFPSLGGQTSTSNGAPTAWTQPVQCAATSSNSFATFPAPPVVGNSNSYAAPSDSARGSSNASTVSNNVPFGRGRGRGASFTQAWSAPGAQVTPLPPSTPTNTLTPSSSINRSNPSGPPPPLSSESQKIGTAKDIHRQWRDGQKEALMAVNEIAKCMRWEPEYQEVCPEGGAFTFYVSIGGRVIGKGSGPTKQEAKRSACQSSQNLLLDWLKIASRTQTDEFSGDVEVGIKKTPIDHYAEIAFGRLKQVRNEASQLAGQIEMPSHFAAFILTTSENQAAQNGIVVAFGTGNHILPHSEAKLMRSVPDKGRSLLDMRALTIARRALQLFLASQVKALLCSTLNNDIVKYLYVEFDPTSNEFVRLRPGHRLHLFMSHAPDGDAVVHLDSKWIDSDTISHSDYERDMNGRCSAYPVNLNDNSGYLQYVSCQNPPHDLRLSFKSGAQDISGDGTGPLSCMSLSDKMLLWYRLGFQGSFLTQWFRTPVRPTSIQVALGYEHGSFTRALFCRIRSQISQTAMRREQETPFLGRVSKLPTNYSRTSQPYSLNYFLDARAGERPVEVIDVLEGRVFSSKQPSRLSRVAALQRYFLLVSLTEEYLRDKPHLRMKFLALTINRMKLPSLPYYKAKEVTYQMCYRRAKKILKDKIQDAGLGVWLGRPAPLQEFCLLDFKIN